MGREAPRVEDQVIRGAPGGATRFAGPVAACL
jgi:hypothetical protein